MSLSNQRGETLITVLIAVAVLAIAALIVPISLGGVKASRQTLQPSHICREVAQNILNTIRSNGVHTTVHRIPTDGATPVARLSSTAWRDDEALFNNLNPSGVQTEIGAVPGVRWPNQPAIDWETGAAPFRVRTPLLIQSATNALLSIFNQPGRQACNNPQGIPITDRGLLSSLPADNITDLHQVNAQIKIRPYNLNTGALEACDVQSPGPLGIRPYAQAEPPAAQGTLFEYSDYRADLGLEAEIVVQARPSTLDERGQRVSDQVIECSVKERIQYDRLDTPPAMPTVQSARRGHMIFSIEGNQYEPGTFMLCRSTYRRVNSFGIPYGPNTTTSWGPCDRLEVCGTQGRTTVHPSRRAVTKEFNVDNDCMLTVSVQAVDIAGNISTVQPVNQYGGPTTVRPPYSSNDNGARGVSGYTVAGEVFTNREQATYAANRLHVAIEPAFNLDPDIARENDRKLTSVNNNLTVTHTAAMGIHNNRTSFAATDNGTSTAAGNAASVARDLATQARQAADRINTDSQGLGPIGETARQTAEHQAQQAEAEAARLEAEYQRRLAAERAREAASGGGTT